MLSVLSLLFLSGCTFDEPLEKTQINDNDDINIIQEIWPQALDQMLGATYTPATVSPVSQVTVPVQTIQNTRATTPSVQQTLPSEEVTVPVQTVQTPVQTVQVSPPTVRQRDSEWEDD